MSHIGIDFLWLYMQNRVELIFISVYTSHVLTIGSLMLLTNNDRILINQLQIMLLG